MKALTELAIQKIKPPASGRLEVRDSLAPGLVLRVTANGAKSWSVVYKVPGEGGVSASGRPLKGKQHRVTLGSWPSLSLSAARAAATDRLRAVALGRTVTSPTVAEALQGLLAVLQTHSKANLHRVLRLHVLPSLGHRKIAEVGWPDVRNLLDRLIVEGRAGTAREVRKHLSRLFSYAADRGLVEHHPMAGRRVSDLRRDEAGRSLTLEEARRVFASASDLGYPFGPLYQLLLLTGARKGEIGYASWSEFADHGIVIPRARFKSRRDHLIPLSGPARKIIDGLPRFTGPFVFSSTAGRAPVSGWSRAKKRLDAAAGLQSSFRVHDLRVTVATQLAGMGTPREIIEATLGHAQPGLVSVYQKHHFVDERREALERWAAVLTA